MTVETFTHAQLMRRSKAAGGLVTARKAERGGRRTARDYMLRGLVRCGDLPADDAGRDYLWGLFLGAAASKILRHAPGPVMILPR